MAGSMSRITSLVFLQVLWHRIHQLSMVLAVSRSDHIPNPFLQSPEDSLSPFGSVGKKHSSLLLVCLSLYFPTILVWSLKRV